MTATEKGTTTTTSSSSSPPGMATAGATRSDRNSANASPRAAEATPQKPTPEVDGKGPGKRLHESSDEGSYSDDDRHDTREGSEDSGGGSDDDDDEGEEDGEGEDGEEGEEEGEVDGKEATSGAQPSLEDPPLPPGPPPGANDDGWQAIWDEQHQAYYFYNALSGQSTWTNPRVPEATVIPPLIAAVAAPEAYAPGTEPADPTGAVEGDPGYEPTYYQLAHGLTDPNAVTAEDIAGTYAATGTFNRFTGKWQAGKTAETYNDENKTKRQMEFYFDVDAAANSHDGRSLKAERQMKKLSKKELKAFREKRKEKKEQKRRAWLKD